MTDIVELVTRRDATEIIAERASSIEVNGGETSLVELVSEVSRNEILATRSDGIEVVAGVEKITEIVVPGGDPAPPVDATQFSEVEVTASADGEQLIALSQEPAAFRLLTINGLQQSAAAYSIAGTTLTLAADLGVLAGDKIHFTFSRS